MVQSAPLGDALPVPKGRSVARSRARLKVVKPADTQTTAGGKDYFVKKDGKTFAGNHILIDPGDPRLVAAALRGCPLAFRPWNRSLDANRMACPPAASTSRVRTVTDRA